MKELEIDIYGRVQGIGFRNVIKEYCDSEEIKGIVFNNDDGSVKVVCQASEEKLHEFLEWLEEDPGFSKIDKILVSWNEFAEKLEGFSISRNGNYVLDKAKSFINLGKGAFR